MPCRALCRSRLVPAPAIEDGTAFLFRVGFEWGCLQAAQRLIERGTLAPVVLMMAIERGLACSRGSIALADGPDDVRAHAEVLEMAAAFPRVDLAVYLREDGAGLVGSVVTIQLMSRDCELTTLHGRHPELGTLTRSVLDLMHLHARRTRSAAN